MTEDPRKDFWRGKTTGPAGGRVGPTKTRAAALTPADKARVRLNSILPGLLPGPGLDMRDPPPVRMPDTLSEYSPTAEDYIADGIAPILGLLGFPGDERARHHKARDMAEGLNWLPGPGTVASVFDGGRALKQENYLDAALNLGLAPLDLIGAGAGIKGARRASADKIARRAAPDLRSRMGYEVGDRLQPSPATAKAGPTGAPTETVRLPGEPPMQARPVAPIVRAAADYGQRRGILADLSRREPYPAYSRDRAQLVAAEFDVGKHAPQDRNVVRGYDAMIEETLDQYRALKDAGIDFRFLKPGMEDPYAASPAMGYRDLVENGRLWVFPTDFGFGSGAAFDPRENPLLKRVGKIGDKADATANDAFRVVHDAYGHFGPGNPFFRAPGEERAWVEHSRMYSPEARAAMTAETRGQNSWVNNGPFAEQNRNASGADTIYTDQKNLLMPKWTLDPYGMPDPEREAYLRRHIASGWGRR